MSVSESVSDSVSESVKFELIELLTQLKSFEVAGIDGSKFLGSVSFPLQSNKNCFKSSIHNGPYGG